MEDQAVEAEEAVGVAHQVCPPHPLGVAVEAAVVLLHPRLQGVGAVVVRLLQRHLDIPQRESRAGDVEARVLLQVDGSLWRCRSPRNPPNLRSLLRAGDVPKIVVVCDEQMICNVQQSMKSHLASRDRKRC